MVGYAARFRQVDIDVYTGVALAIHRKQHWLRRARQEHINRSGVCVADSCDCPNCREHREVVGRAALLHECSQNLTTHDAFDRAGYEVTRGAASSPWSDPS